MKSYLTILGMSIILFGCSNKDDNPTQELPNDLLITSFSPTSAVPGDAITFIGENIDPEITYIVSFNGVNGETTSVSETEIVAIVPLGATSGEVVISYEDKNLTVGTIEIVDEGDKLFGYFFPDGCSLMKINNLDINTGELLEEVAKLYAGSCEEYVKSRFYRASNFFIYTYYEHTVQGMPPQKHGLIKDFNSDVVYNWGLGRDPDIQEDILTTHDNRIYYSYRNQIDVDEAYEIRSANLNKRDIQIIYEFPFDYTYDLRNSGFLPSTNELVFFTKDESDQPIFMKLNVETSILTSTNIPETYSKIFITKTERMFGVKSLAGEVHEIVELDQGSGNLLSSLATISAKEVKNIDYSLSSNKIFALLEDKNRPWDQYLYKLNLSDGTSTTTRLDEQNNHANFHGIYLND